MRQVCQLGWNLGELQVAEVERVDLEPARLVDAPASLGRVFLHGGRILSSPGHGRAALARRCNLASGCRGEWRVPAPPMTGLGYRRQTLALRDRRQMLLQTDPLAARLHPPP